MSEKKSIFPVNYLPATLRVSNTRYYIEYYTLHPQDKTMKRMRIKLHHLRKRCRTLAEFKLLAYDRINIINNKLAGGWSPFFESENTRLYTLLSDVIDMYIAEKERELRAATIRSYKSGCYHLKKWSEENVTDIYCGMFNRVIAVRYLDDIYRDIKSARIWNNRLKMCRAFFEWAVEKCYCKENPFAGFKTKKESAKKCILIPEDTRTKILVWCEENNPPLGAVCQFVFNSLIRPKEIAELRVKDVYIAQHYIHVPGTVAKNHNERFATLTPRLEEYFLKLNLHRYPSNYYLFGSCGNVSKDNVAHSYFGSWWNRMRKDLKLPKEMQLYSLRDTGINNLLKSGIDPLTVMQHADHHDLAMTTRYANHADPNLINTIYNHNLKF